VYRNPSAGSLEAIAALEWLGRASNHQEDYPSLTERDRRTQSSTMTSMPLSKARKVGHLLSQLTPDTH